MSYLEFKQELNQLEPLFTSDGWRLLRGYVLSLQERLQGSDMTEDQQEAVLRGILEFVYEYSSDTRGGNLISFDRTLSLMEELGSPSEIIQTSSHQPPVSVSQVPAGTAPQETHMAQTGQICSYCKYNNAVDAQYCENCGRSIQGVPDPSEKDYPNWRQDIIDHPYSRSFLLWWLGLGLLALIARFLNPNVDDRLGLEVILTPTIASEVLGSALITFFPAILLGIITGALLDWLWKDQKSLTYRYEKAMEHFEDALVFGALILMAGAVVLTIVMFGTNALLQVQTEIFGLMAILLWGSSIGYCIYTGWKSDVDKPKDLSYPELLSLKHVAEQRTSEQLIQANKRFLIPIIASALGWSGIVAWGSMNNSTGVSEIVGVALLVGVTLGLLLVLNGLLGMYYYSWSQLKKLRGERSGKTLFS